MAKSSTPAIAVPLARSRSSDAAALPIMMLSRRVPKNRSEVLVDDAYRPAHFVRVKLPDVDIVDQHRPSWASYSARQQPPNSGLAGADLADDPDLLTRLDCKAQTD